jgi:hypothetical protein
MLESRIGIGKSLLFLVIGVVALLGNWALYHHGRFYYPAIWGIGAILVLFGLRAFDRRVKLRIAPHGILYAQWGSEWHPWSDFARFSIFTHSGFPFIQPHLVDEERFRRNVPPLVKLGAAVNRLAGRPAYYINPSQLEASAQSIVEALRAHVAVQS